MSRTTVNKPGHVVFRVIGSGAPQGVPNGPINRGTFNAPTHLREEGALPPATSIPKPSGPGDVSPFFGLRPAKMGDTPSRQCGIDLPSPRAAPTRRGDRDSMFRISARKDVSHGFKRISERFSPLNPPVDPLAGEQRERF